MKFVGLKAQRLQGPAASSAGCRIKREMVKKVGYLNRKYMVELVAHKSGRRQILADSPRRLIWLLQPGYRVRSGRR
jgi:hypothetical protein